jgi:hypothetical protein
MHPEGNNAGNSPWVKQTSLSSRKFVEPLAALATCFCFSVVVSELLQKNNAVDTFTVLPQVRDHSRLNRTTDITNDETNRQ